MAAAEMYDYLPTAAPDVDITLSVNAQARIDEEGDKNIEIHTGQRDCSVVPAKTFLQDPTQEGGFSYTRCSHEIDHTLSNLR